MDVKDIIKKMVGDGSAAHYLSAAFTAVPYAFRDGKISNITHALEAASECWASYEDAERGEKFNFNRLRRPAAGGDSLIAALDAFVSHQLAKHQDQGTLFNTAMSDIKRQWLEFADADAAFLPYVFQRCPRATI